MMLDAALFSPTATPLLKAASHPQTLPCKDTAAVSRDLQEAFVGWLTSMLAMPTSAAYKYAFLTDTVVRTHKRPPQDMDLTWTRRGPRLPWAPPSWR